MSINLDEIKRAHHKLMKEYIRALNEVSNLPFFAPRRLSYLRDEAETSKSRKGPIKWLNSWLNRAYDGWMRLGLKLLTLQYLVRLFTESHIKGKLNELSVAYLYLAQTIPEDETSTNGAHMWLKEVQESCDKIAETLLSWTSTRGTLNALWPIGIGLATAALGADNIYELLIKFDASNPSYTQFLSRLVAILIFPTVYFVLYLGSAFDCKREIFMPGYTSNERPLQGDADRGSRENVYQIEDHLFSLLQRGKRREIHFGIIILVSFLFMLGAYPTWLWLTNLSEPIAWVFGIVGCWMIYDGIKIAARRRQWR